MVRSVEEDTRGIVSPRLAFEHFTLERIAPKPPIDRFVDRFWITSWDLPQPFQQQVVPPPAVNLVFESDGTSQVSGVLTGEFHRCIEGRGWVFGVLFRPGGFRTFVDTPMNSLTDRRGPIGWLFGAPGETLALDVAAAVDHQARAELVEDFLGSRLPLDETVGEHLSDLIASVTERRPSPKVCDVASEFGVSTRTLQRLFAQHIGVGPKWVLDRYRVQAAAEVARHPVESWADVANQLGYSDQAHLTSAVSQAFGQPPAAYARGEEL